MSSYRMLIQRDKRGVLLAHRKSITPKKNTFFLVLMSFILPLLLLAPAFMYSGIFPFGDHTTLAVDLRNQYVGFFEALRRVTADPGSLLYNFTKGPGGIMSATDAYYLLSPLNLLFFLFPSENLPLAVELIQLVKIGLSGLFFSILLIRREHGDDWRILLFSTCYALMSFTMANMLNVMWLDLLYMTPLVVLFLERLMDGKSAVPYVLCLSLSIIINFYMAYMLCIFLVLYAIWAIVRRSSAMRETGTEMVKQCFKLFIRFALYSFIAGALTAWLIFPNMYSLLLSKGPYQDEVVADSAFRYPVGDPFSRLIPAAFDYDQVSNGFANIYTGIAPAILGLFYFFNPRIALRERICSLGILVFLLLSMNMKKLNVLWHGMQYPIWYNYRFSWLFSFFTLLIAFRGFLRLHRIRLVQLIAVVVFYVALVLYLGIRMHSDSKLFPFLTYAHLIGTFVAAIVFLILFVDWSKNRHGMGSAAFFLLLLTCIDLSVNAAVYTACFAYETRTEFAFFHQQMREALDPIRPKNGSFYRIEKTFMHDSNDGMRFNYSGLTHFNSTYEYNTIELLSSLGFSRGRASTAGGNATKFTDALFGIRYYLDGKYDPQEEGLVEGINTFKSKSHRPDILDMPLVADYTHIRVYENPWCMPLGMLAEESLATFSAGHMNPLDFQDHLANLVDGLPGSEINYFKHFVLTPPQLENLTQGSGKGSLKVYHRADDDKDTKARLNYTVHTTGKRSAYLTISETFNTYNSFVYLDDEQIGNKRSGNVTTSQVLNVAAANEGEKTQKLSIQMHRDKDTFQLNTIALFTLDEDALRKAVDFQQKHGLKLTNFSSTSFSGSFTAVEGTPYLLLSLPYDEGWTAKLDGKKISTISVLDSLTAIPVTPGEHTLEMHFRTPLLLPGISLSITTLVLFLILLQNERKAKKQKMVTNLSIQK